MNSLGSQLWLTFELRIAHMTNIHIIHIHIQLSISTFTDLVHLINRLVRKVVGCRVVASQPEIAAYIHIIHSRTGHATWAKGKLCSPAESTWKLSWDHPLFLEGSSLWSTTLRTSGCPKNSQIFPPAPSFFFFLLFLSEDICDEGHQQAEAGVLAGKGVWTHRIWVKVKVVRLWKMASLLADLN